MTKVILALAIRRKKTCNLQVFFLAKCSNPKNGGD